MRQRTGVQCAAPPLETIVKDAVVRLLPDGATRDVSTITVTDSTVGPGQLNEHFRVDTADSGSFLVKVTRRGGLGALQGEAVALRMLAEASDDDDSLQVPQSLATGSIDSGLRAWMVLRWIDYSPFGAAIPSVQAQLGAALARLHMRSAERMQDVHQGRFGFPVSTWLGAAEQENEWSPVGDWLGFFVSRRLQPRLTAAVTKFGDAWGTSNENVLALSTVGSRLCHVSVLRCLFEGVTVRPSLIHGDLFMGNAGSHGKGRVACLYDAASYFAHDEMDLALSTMWGRFGPGFYESYHRVRGPTAPHFAERQELYRLYYLLTMLVLHGPGYGSRGSVENPDGYLERCVRSLTDLDELTRRGSPPR